MSKHIVFTNGVLTARYDSKINDVIPVDAVEVDDDTFFKTIDENDGVWSLVNGDIVKVALQASQADLAYRARMARIPLLQAADIAINKAVDNELPVFDLCKYRKSLRDITIQPGFPETIKWPIPPAGV